MKFTVPKAAFLDAVAQAAGVLDKNPTALIMGCVHVVANRTGIHVRGVSTAADLTITVPQEVDSFGGASFEAKVLLAALKSASAETVTMETVKPGKVRVTIGGATHNLNVMDPENAPVLPAAETTLSMTYRADELVRTLRIVDVAVPAEDNRYGMPGMYAEVTDGGVRFLALDGGRLVYADTSTVEHSGTPPAKALVAKGMVHAIISLCDGCGESEVRLSLGQRASVVTMDYVKFTFRMVEGDVLDYRVILASYNAKATVRAKRDDVLAAVKAVLPTAKDSLTTTAWAWGRDSLRVSTTMSDSGSSECSAPCHMDGEEQTVGLNAKWMYEALSLAGHDINVKVHGPLGPVMVDDGSTWMYIQSPVRL